jgi:hypothetical protein
MDSPVDQATADADAQVQQLLALYRTDTERRNATRIWLAVWILEARKTLPADDLQHLAGELAPAKSRAWWRFWGAA